MYFHPFGVSLTVSHNSSSQPIYYTKVQFTHIQKKPEVCKQCLWDVAQKLIHPDVWSKIFISTSSLCDIVWTLIINMILHWFAPKTKCNFSKTASEVYTSVCYMDLAKTPVGLELTHSMDCAL